MCFYKSMRYTFLLLDSQKLAQFTFIILPGVTTLFTSFKEKQGAGRANEMYYYFFVINILCKKMQSIELNLY